MSDQNPYAPPPGGAPSPSAGPPADPRTADQPPPLPQPSHQPSPQPTHQPGPQQPYQPYQQAGYDQPYQQAGYDQPYQSAGYDQQVGYDQPYQQAGYAGAPPSAGTGGVDDRPMSSLAVIGFIVSLVGLIIIPVALIGLILSLVALPGTGSAPGKRKGRGFAIAGAIIGGILTLLGIVSIIFFAVAFSQIDTDGDGTWSDEEIEDFFGIESDPGFDQESDFEDLFENTAVEGAGAAAVPADPAALVVA
ncbi:MAG: hypothetical protein ACFCVF_14565 [Kineosporiaceae bacterium]